MTIGSEGTKIILAGAYVKGATPIKSDFKRVEQWATFARRWYLYDARWQDAAETASLLRYYLLGRTKPIYSPFCDTGDHVVCINAKYIAFEGDLWEKVQFFEHLGYPGTAKWVPAWEHHRRDPTSVLRMMIRRKMPGNIYGKQRAPERLHVYANDKIPDDIMANITHQIRRLRPVPEKLARFTDEEKQAFPKLWKPHKPTYIPGLQ